MKKLFFGFLLCLAALVVLGGCVQQKACTQEAKLCPGGTSVGRNSDKNCEFDDCPPLLGGDRDVHGCIPSAGYSWCEAKQKCLRPWEENCNEVTIESKARELCGRENVAEVDICGDYVKVVSSLMGGGSTFYEFDFGNLVDETKCPVVGPDYVSEKCGLLINGQNCVEKKIC